MTDKFDRSDRGSYNPFIKTMLRVHMLGVDTHRAVKQLMQTGIN
jgi:hypothetical protein